MGQLYKTICCNYSYYSAIARLMVEDWLLFCSFKLHDFQAYDFPCYRAELGALLMFLSMAYCYSR